MWFIATVKQAWHLISCLWPFWFPFYRKSRVATHIASFIAWILIHRLLPESRLLFANVSFKNCIDDMMFNIYIYIFLPMSINLFFLQLHFMTNTSESLFEYNLVKLVGWNIWLLSIIIHIKSKQIPLIQIHFGSRTTFGVILDPQHIKYISGDHSKYR